MNPQIRIHRAVLNYRVLALCQIQHLLEALFKCVFTFAITIQDCISLSSAHVCTLTSDDIDITAVHVGLLHNPHSCLISENSKFI